MCQNMQLATAGERDGGSGDCATIAAGWLTRSDVAFLGTRGEPRGGA